ncbi:MAG: sensor histidine kinase [Deltaproteobacteria bacterium]|nr:sensor histidine kinase [Deltaproteobacteria bacterium]
MISRELHDGIAQDLTVSKIEMDMLLENASALNPVAKPKVMGISDSLKRAISAVRNLSYDLRPPGLDQTNLIEAIYNYCEDFSEKTGLIVNFTSAGMEERNLNYDTRINLFRLVQEGLHNTWKHADARHAAIKMVSVYPNIILRIEDDGKGFDVEKRLRAVKDEKRLGLRSMEERVQLLEGHIKIQSKPMQGTKIYIKIPHIE